jgi:hypothetical protein
MSYTIRLEDSTGAVLDELHDTQGWLDQWTFNIASDSLRISDLDPSGETRFNRIQSARILEETAMLRQFARGTGQTVFLTRLDEMLERCRDDAGCFVIFRGGK